MANGEPEKMEAGNSEAAATEAKPEKDQEANTQALQQLIARILVDPNTTIPLDSAALHRKVVHCHPQQLADGRYSGTRQQTANALTITLWGILCTSIAQSKD